MHFLLSTQCLGTVVLVTVSHPTATFSFFLCLDEGASQSDAKFSAFFDDVKLKDALFIDSQTSSISMTALDVSVDVILFTSEFLKTKVQISKIENPFQTKYYVQLVVLEKSGFVLVGICLKNTTGSYHVHHTMTNNLVSD